MIFHRMSFLSYLKTGLYALFILCIYLHADAQYYTAAFGKNGAVLKTALHNIIKGHTVGTYAGLWTDYYTTDNRGGNILWDIYSDVPGASPVYTYTLGTSQCGTYNSEGDCYNREHVWPQSYFNGVPPMYTDIQQIYPTDGYVNAKHGDLPYGVVNVASWTSQNGSKVGSSGSYTGYTNDVFEPIDSFKGDIARVYFYMSTRYEGEDSNWASWPMATKAVLTADAIALLLSWHHLDPVSQKETDRNNAAFAIQGNRNPFIDYPEFADCIWGTGDCTALGVTSIQKESIQVYPNPASDELFLHHPSSISIESVQLFNMTGMLVRTETKAGDRLSLQGITPGNYLLLMYTDKGLQKQLIRKN